MSDQLKVVFTAGPGEAAIVRELLAAAGISAELSREGAGAAYGFTLGPMGMVDVLVTASDAAAAEELVAAMERGDLETNSAVPDDSDGPDDSDPTE